MEGATGVVGGERIRLVNASLARAARSQPMAGSRQGLGQLEGGVEDPERFPGQEKEGILRAHIVK